MRAYAGVAASGLAVSTVHHHELEAALAIFVALFLLGVILWEVWK